MAGTFSPVSALRMKNSLEDHGLAISSTLAMVGALSVACGTRALGSGAGDGTSICGCSAVLVSAWRGRSAQRAPKNTATRARIRTIPAMSDERSRAAGRASPAEMPGICGISALKRSASGFKRSDGDGSGIGLFAVTLYLMNAEKGKSKMENGPRENGKEKIENGGFLNTSV